MICLNWQDVILGDYSGVEDSWMEVVGRQGESLLAIDISSSAVTDTGLLCIEGCQNMQRLCLNYCDQISDTGILSLSGKYYSCA